MIGLWGQRVLEYDGDLHSIACWLGLLGGNGANDGEHSWVNHVGIIQQGFPVLFWCRLCQGLASYQGHWFTVFLLCIGNVMFVWRFFVLSQCRVLESGEGMVNVSRHGDIIGLHVIIPI